MPDPALTGREEEEARRRQVMLHRAKRVARDALDRYKAEREELRERSEATGIEHVTPLQFRPY